MFLGAKTGLCRIKGFSHFQLHVVVGFHSFSCSFRWSPSTYLPWNAGGGLAVWLCGLGLWLCDDLLDDHDQETTKMSSASYVGGAIRLRSVFMLLLNPTTRGIVSRTTCRVLLAVCPSHESVASSYHLTWTLVQAFPAISTSGLTPGLSQQKS